MEVHLLNMCVECRNMCMAYSRSALRDKFGLCTAHGDPTGGRICSCTDVHTKSVWRRARGITNGEYQNSSAYVNICTICNGIRENRGCKRMVSLILRWRKWWKGLCWVDVLKGCGAIRPWHTMSFLGPISFSRLMKRTHTPIFK